MPPAAHRWLTDWGKVLVNRRDYSEILKSVNCGFLEESAMPQAFFYFCMIVADYLKRGHFFRFSHKADGAFGHVYDEADVLTIGNLF